MEYKICSICKKELELTSENFYKDIEVNKYLDDIYIYFDDCCEIYIDVIKKDIMSM